MGEIIVKNAVKRERGWMYYVDGRGNLCRAKFNHPKKMRIPQPYQPPKNTLVLDELE